MNNANLNPRKMVNSRNFAKIYTHENIYVYSTALLFIHREEGSIALTFIDPVITFPVGTQHHTLSENRPFRTLKIWKESH